MADDTFTAEQWERFRARAMSPDELLAYDRLLAGSSVARDELARRRRLGAPPPREDLSEVDDLFQRLGLEGAHLPTSLLQRFVDDQALAVGERTRLESHLAACGRCRDDVETLRALRQELEAAPSRIPVPAPAPARRSHLYSWTVPAALTMNAAAIALVWFGLSGRYATMTTAWEKERTNLENAAQVAENARIEALGQHAREQQNGKKLAAKVEDLKAQVRRLEARPLPTPPPGGWVVAQVDPGEVRALNRAWDQGDAPLWQPPASTGVFRSGAVNPLTLGDPPARPGAFGVVSPTRTAIAAVRPPLTWNPHPGAANYRIVVKDPKGRVIDRSTDIAAPRTTYRVARALVREQAYRWQVYALDAQGEPIGSVATGGFTIVSVKAARRSAEAMIRAALLESRAGLYDQASQTLTRVAEDFPDLPEAATASKIVNDLRAKRNPH